MINPHWQIYKKYSEWKDSDIRKDLKSFGFTCGEQNYIIHKVHDYRKEREILLTWGRFNIDCEHETRNIL